MFSNNERGNMIQNNFTNEHELELRRCKDVLENPSFIIKLSSYVGKPVEFAIDNLPVDVRPAIDKALRFALESAILTINKNKIDNGFLASNMKDRIWVVASGMVGGIGGFSTVLAELPATTTLILRSIAKIANSHGFDIYKPATKVACMEVFSLGSLKTTSDDNAENSYVASRLALAFEINSASAYMSKIGVQNIVSAEAPAMVALLNKIVPQFGVVATNKIIAQSLPIISAGTAAMINYLFISHYQKMADAHFSVLKMEEKFSKEFILDYYKKI